MIGDSQASNAAMDFPEFEFNDPHVRRINVIIVPGMDAATACTTTTSAA